MNEDHRCALAQYFINEFEIGIITPLRMICTDEFMIWMARKINTKNDAFYTFDIQTVPESTRYNRCPRTPSCVGVFIPIAN